MSVAIINIVKDLKGEDLTGLRGGEVLSDSGSSSGVWGGSGSESVDDDVGWIGVSSIGGLLNLEGRFVGSTFSAGIPSSVLGVSSGIKE